MWAIEFVQDKETKQPFPAEMGVARRIRQRGLERHGISLQPNSGCVNGVSGDYIMLSPAYNITAEDVGAIVKRTTDAVVDYFQG